MKQSAKKKTEKKPDWLLELRTLDAEIKNANLPDVARGSIEQRLEAALHNLEVYEEELRVQNEELVRARAESEASLKKYAALFLNSPFGYFIVNERHMIREVNLTGAQMLGHTRDFLFSKPLWLYVDPSDRDNLDSHFRATFADDHSATEIRFISRNGEPFSAIVESALVSHDFGSGQHCLTAISDITQRKAAEDALKDANRHLLAAQQEAEQASRAKSEFLATMSHELRTPLNAVIGFSELIKEEALGPIEPNKYAEYIADIHASGKHLLEAVNDVLDIARIESRQLAVTPRPIDIRGIFDECASIMALQASRKKLSLKCSTALDTSSLMADKRALIQILSNLVDNAITFTEEGGVIRVEARPLDDGGVQLSVSDTGVGIPDEHLDRILLPFERVDGVYSREVDGTGLGLSISKGLMELHGGSLSIESEVGKGTTVRLRFPPRVA